MKIRRLEIVGFKSFVDRVCLEFPEGVTAVVGPNGCGKSNVVDAIRWVMGEQSAKNLRGRQMEDIIFGGSESRKPLGMAEVSIVFSSDDGGVPAKYSGYSEIQVTRRLYRDGESEYYLNKTPCRLMDISELFMDTGVGARAYSIIEQGRIGMILLSKPEERRFLIEEAAGVTKFKVRKQVALKKIDSTRQNLVRIGDIISEIRRQLGSLQRQAKKAERFRALREELKEIELCLMARRFAVLENERKDVTAEVKTLEGRIAALSAEQGKGDLALEERKILLLEGEKGVTAAQEEIYRLKNEILASENRQIFQKKELENLEKHALRLSEELKSLERQLVEGETELRLLDGRKAEFGSGADEECLRLARSEQELEQLTVGERAIVAQVEEKRRELFTLLAEVTKYGNQKTAAARRLEGMGDRQERFRREDLLLREKLLQSGERIAGLNVALGGRRELRKKLAEEVTDLKVKEAELKDRLLATDQQLQRKRDESNRKGSRLHSLQELEAQLAGYGQGVRNLFHAEKFTGRFPGLVADLIETDEEFEPAVEAILGERIQYIVTEESHAVEAITHLKETSGGRCSFLSGFSSLPAVDSMPAGAISLLQRVKVAEQYRQLIEPILASAWLVEDLAAAIAHARKFPACSFVTREGDLAHSGGIISGGSSEEVRHGVIHKKREIRELAAEVAHLKEVLLVLENARKELQLESRHIDDTLRELRNTQHETDMQILHDEKDLLRAREESQRCEERIAINELEHEQLREEMENLEREIVDSGRGKEVAEAGQQSLERELEVLSASLHGQKQRIEAVREAVTALKVSVAALREKRESTERACRRLQDLVRDISSRIAVHRDELTKGGEEQERLSSAISVTAAVLQDLLLREREAETAFSGTRARYDHEAAALRDKEGELKSIRSMVDDARAVATEKNVKLSELNLQLRHVETLLNEKYRVGIADLQLIRQPDGDEAEQSGRQQELQRLVDDLGEVNLTAIEEYRELEERFSFLMTQKEDLEESLNSLQQAIQRINRTTRKRFVEAFQQVNAKFQEVFPRLFCGGRAELRLTEPENVLETGIDIIVQPPGKKLQNVTLLSGGEKALTAVALIFSIFLIKPSPFCLLDEVDAPLDDANISRFNEMIREMTSFSQFILITHSKTTMAVADTLYGVTMEEPGVSKLVSVRLN